MEEEPNNNQNNNPHQYRSRLPSVDLFNQTIQSQYINGQGYEHNVSQINIQNVRHQNKIDMPYNFQEITDTPLLTYLQNDNTQKLKELSQEQLSKDYQLFNLDFKAEKKKNNINNKAENVNLEEFFYTQQYKQYQKESLKKKELKRLNSIEKEGVKRKHKESVNLSEFFDIFENIIEEEEKEEQIPIPYQFNAQDFFNDKISQKVNQDIIDSVKQGTTLEIQKEFSTRFDNYLNLEQLTSQSIFEKEMLESYRQFIQINQANQGEKSMSDILKHISEFSLQIANKLTFFVSKCDKSFCFDYLKQQKLKDDQQSNVSYSTNSNSYSNQSQMSQSNFGSNQQNLQQKIKRSRWTTEEKQHLTNLLQMYYPQSVPNQEILQLAQKLGRTQKAVRVQLGKLKKIKKQEQNARIIQ